MNYILDFSKAEKRTISNDAFYFITADEPVIDETNLREVKSLYEQYEDFAIDEDYEFLDDGLVGVTIIPYKEDDFQCDEYLELFNGWQLQINWIDSKKAKIRYYNMKKPPFGEEEVEVRINSAGKPEIKTSGGSTYPIWKNMKKGRN